MSLENNESKVIQGRFHLTKKLGAGSFGEIFEAKDLKTGKLYACKAESIRTKHPQLRLEYQIYRALQRSPSFVRVWGYVQHYNHQIMIMDKLGDSLEQLFTICGRKFSIGCVCIIAIQILQRIQELHEHHYLHRDIKPDNFLIGQGDYHSEEAGKIYMIDLGLGKLWKENGRHIPEKHGKRLIGTPRYASIKTHFGHEQSRRDDLESLGYMLMYFVHGHLPWQGLRGATKEEKYQKIGHKKRDTRLTELCGGYPDEFREYLQRCQNLKFVDEPPYNEFRALFERVLRRQPAHKRCFDWQSPKFQSRKNSQQNHKINNVRTKIQNHQNHNNDFLNVNVNNNTSRRKRRTATPNPNNPMISAAAAAAAAAVNPPPPNHNHPNNPIQPIVPPPQTNPIQTMNPRGFNTNNNAPNRRSNNLRTNRQQQPPPQQHRNNNFIPQNRTPPYQQQQQQQTAAVLQANYNNPLSLPNLHASTQQLVPINQVLNSNNNNNTGTQLQTNNNNNNTNYNDLQTRYNRCVQRIQNMNHNQSNRRNCNVGAIQLNTNNNGVGAQLAAAAAVHTQQQQQQVVNVNLFPSSNQHQTSPPQPRRYEFNNNYHQTQQQQQPPPQQQQQQRNSISPLAAINNMNHHRNNNNRGDTALMKEYKTLLSGYKKLEGENEKLKLLLREKNKENTEIKNKLKNSQNAHDVYRMQLNQKQTQIDQLRMENIRLQQRQRQNTDISALNINHRPAKKRRLNGNISRRSANRK